MQAFFWRSAVCVWDNEICLSLWNSYTAERSQDMARMLYAAEAKLEIIDKKKRVFTVWESFVVVLPNVDCKVEAATPQKNAAIDVILKYRSPLPTLFPRIDDIPRHIIRFMLTSSQEASFIPFTNKVFNNTRVGSKYSDTLHVSSATWCWALVLGI